MWSVRNIEMIAQLIELILEEYASIFPHCIQKSPEYL